jgi:hypothetical protein
MYYYTVSDKNGSFQAFDTTKVTTLGDDLFKISSKIPFFLFSVLMEGISVVFFTAVFLLWAINPDTWILDELCIFATFSVFFFGLVLLLSVLKFFKPFMKITDKIKPIRFKVKMEMFPVNRKKVLEDLIGRLDEVFCLNVKDNSKLMNKKVKTKNGNHEFDIFYESRKGSMIYVFTILMLTILLVSIFFEALVYSHFESPLTFLLLAVLELIVLAIFITVILRFFFRNEVMMVKVHNKKVTRKDILSMKKMAEDVLVWHRCPLIIAVLSKDGFSDEATDIVKTTKGKVHEEYTITLIEMEGKRFNIIWTG